MYDYLYFHIWKTECHQSNDYKLPGRTFFRIPWTLSRIKVMFFCCHSAMWAAKII